MATRPLSKIWLREDSDPGLMEDEEKAAATEGDMQEQKGATSLIVGTTELYENGQIRLIPVRGLALRCRELLMTQLMPRCQPRTLKVLTLYSSRQSASNAS